MSDPGFAQTPKPPYYAVIFSARRRQGDSGYAETATRMAELAARQPGYLGMEHARDEAGFGITVAYFESEAAIRDWKRNLEHIAAQEKGRSTWYSHYEIRVAKVERAYNFTAPQTA